MNLKFLNLFLQPTRYNLPPSRGFSVVEILLAGSLLVVIVTAFVGAVIYGQESTVVAGGRARAAFLAEEGIEAVRNIRDESFSNLADGTYGLAVSNYQWIFSGSSDTTDGFVRQINISTIDASSTRKIITSNVTWQETAQRSGTITLTERLTNWRQ